MTHPEEDRFCSRDLRAALQEAGLPVQDALEVRQLGILAICRKIPA